MTPESNALARQEQKLSPETMETVLLKGDLAALNPQQRIAYYRAVCESVGLNPLTQPFSYIKLNGNLVLYAKRDCTDQLRKINNISITVASREVSEGCYVVTARAQSPNGRQDESLGAVQIDGLKGEARSNAMMKAETKAKRRVTLSICGLAFMDESEVDSTHATHVSVDQQGQITSGTCEAAQEVAQRKIAAGSGKPLADQPPPEVFDAEFVEPEDTQPFVISDDPEVAMHQEILFALSNSQRKATVFNKFKMMPEFQKLHKRFTAMEADEAYYRVLNRCGVEKSNQFTDENNGLMARVAYKELAWLLGEMEAAKLSAQLGASLDATVPECDTLPDAVPLVVGEKRRYQGAIWHVVDTGDSHGWELTPGTAEGK